MFKQKGKGRRQGGHYSQQREHVPKSGQGESGFRMEACCGRCEVWLECGCRGQGQVRFLKLEGPVGRN